MPKVSLIIPVYNVEKYLDRCIASIAKQSFTDYEAIFVNDGSTDNSRDLCEKLISEYPNFRLVNKKNGGLTSARILGFHESCGQYISFIDSDDYLHPEYLKMLYETASIHHADVSMCCYYTDKEGEIVEVKLDFPDNLTVINKEDIFGYYMLPQLPSLIQSDRRIPSFMWLRMYNRRVLTENFFISERHVFQEDLASSLYTYRLYNKVVVINTPLYYYCINQGSLTLRYRDRAWDMICNLHEATIHTLNSINTEEVSARLQGQLLVGAFFCLRNSMAKKQYCTFKTIFEAIRKNKNFKQEVLRYRLSNTGLKTKIMLSLIKWNIPGIMYLIYKIKK